MYPVGNCDNHPGIQCCKAPNGWHFDLSDSNRIKVFVNALVSNVKLTVHRSEILLNVYCKLRRTTSAERAPVGGQFFSLKDHLKDGLELQSQTPLTPQPPPLHHQMYSMTSPWSLFGGHSNFPFPYGMPSQITNANQQPPGYFPQVYSQQWGPPMPYAAGSQGPMSPTPGSHFQVQSSIIPGPSHVGPPDPIDTWGHQFGLDAEECGYLRKLGFRVGDNLDAISEKMWEAAAVPVCHCVSILKAYSLSFTASAATSE